MSAKPLWGAPDLNVSYALDVIRQGTHVTIWLGALPAQPDAVPAS
ncbi:MAG TPA: hypothetical protein VFQ48_11975 [Pseudonocardiaceae bacterium]|nr:hypothetical protein [Pseudonocardiaceae bacterium]